eukprot:gene28425-26996_t
MARVVERHERAAADAAAQHRLRALEGAEQHALRADGHAAELKEVRMDFHAARAQAVAHEQESASLRAAIELREGQLRAHQREIDAHKRQIAELGDACAMGRQKLDDSLSEYRILEER